MTPCHTCRHLIVNRCYYNSRDTAMEQQMNKNFNPFTNTNDNINSKTTIFYSVRALRGGDVICYVQQRLLV
eukprot:m.151781 g.151781  ORF g.151781 m.151781 type:complete len:71 (+) comp13295_c0_seq12:2075-2287(+)